MRLYSKYGINVHKLKFSGLQPEHGQINKSACYLLMANTEEHGLDLALASLCDDSKNFMISQNIDRFLAKCTDENQRLIKPFVLDKDYFTSHRQSYLEQLIEELSFYAGFKSSHIIVHFSEDLLVNFDADFARKLLRKCNQLAGRYKFSLVLLLTGQQASDTASLFLANNHLLHGMAQLNSHLMNHRLQFDFWRHESGITCKDVYQVEFDDEVGEVIVELEQSESLRDEDYHTNLDQVFIVKDLLPSDTQLPPNYHVCQDNQDVIDQVLENKAATAVLYASKNIEKSVLAAQCYKLREACGPWLKIVIKNRDGILRHHDECVFLTLGVNLILHTTTDISRLMSQVQALQGVKFARKLPKDYKTVLVHADGVEEKGYLVPAHFIQATMRQREASLSTGISGVLVVLDLIKGIEPIDALRLFSVKRGGDFFTASNNQVLLYLHACRENDVTNALERLFRLAISEFFSAHSIYSQDLYIDQICRDLKQADENQETEDFSILLMEASQDETPLKLSTSGRSSNAVDIERFPSRKKCQPFELKLLEAN